MKGRTDTTINPSENITRAEIAQMLVNYMVNENNIKLSGVSLGYAYYDEKKTDIQDVIAQADEVMYKNKCGNMETVDAMAVIKDGRTLVPEHSYPPGVFKLDRSADGALGNASNGGNFTNEMKLPITYDYNDYGANAVDRKGDHKDSPYFSSVAPSPHSLRRMTTMRSAEWF